MKWKGKKLKKVFKRKKKHKDFQIKRKGNFGMKEFRIRLHWNWFFFI